MLILSRCGGDNLLGIQNKDSLQQISPGRFGTNPFLQVVLIDRSGLYGEIFPERWDLIAKRFIEFMMEQSCDGNITRISSIGWFSDIKIVECENEGTIKFLVEAVMIGSDFSIRSRPTSNSDAIFRRVNSIRSSDSDWSIFISVACGKGWRSDV